MESGAESGEWKGALCSCTQGGKKKVREGKRQEETRRGDKGAVRQERDVTGSAKDKRGKKQLAKSRSLAIRMSLSTVQKRSLVMRSDGTEDSLGVTEG